VIQSGKLVKSQEGEFLASLVEQTQVKPERGKFQSEELFKRKRIDDLNSWGRVNLQAQRNSFSIAFRHIGVGVCKSCMHVEIASCDFLI
jgi:hypothetical protein